LTPSGIRRRACRRRDSSPGHLALSFEPGFYVDAPEPPPPTHPDRRQIAFTNQPVDRPGRDPQVEQNLASRHQFPTRISAYCHIKTLKLPHMAVDKMTLYDNL